jgi:hypothetical protein
MKISYGKNFRGQKGITLIVLAITIIVLLILARNNNCDFNRREWNIKKCRKCKRTSGNRCRKRNY